MSNLIDTKITVPYDSFGDLTLISPGAIRVNESGNDNLYALRFSKDFLTGTLDGVISSKGTGINTCGINFVLMCDLIFSAGKAAIIVSGSQNAYGFWGGTVQIGAAAGSLGGAVNVSAKSFSTATATVFKAFVNFSSPLAMTVSAVAAGANANAYGFVFKVKVAGGLDDKFKLTVKAKAGKGNASARGANGDIILAGALAGTVSVAAAAAKGSSADAVGLAGVTGITDVSDKFKLTVTAKAGTGAATANGVTGAIQVSGVVSGAINVSADAARGTDATVYGINALSGSAIGDKFVFTVKAKAGSGAATAYGSSDTSVITGVVSGKFTFSADAAKGTDAAVYGIRRIDCASIGDKFKLTATAKSGSGSAAAQGFYGSLKLSGILSGTMVVCAAAKGTSASAVGGYGITGSGISDQFKLTVTAKSGSGAATAEGFSSNCNFSETLSGSLVITADAAKGSNAQAYGFTGITAKNISDKFKLTVTAKAVSGAAQALGSYDYPLALSGILSGTVVVSADAARGTNAVAYGFSAISGITDISDQFKLTVSAKAGTGDSYAQGLGVNDVTNLSGILTVAAESFSGAAEAIGCKILSDSFFSVLETCTVTVAAKTSSADDDAIAAGLSGSSGKIDFAGRLAVTATGGIATAYGVRFDSKILSGSCIQGVVSAVGGQAYGVYGGNSSILTIDGAVYGGMRGNAAAIANSLAKAVGSYKSASALNHNADQAIRLGDYSTASLESGSIVIGDVTLGDNSTLKLSTGSQLYGDIAISSSDIDITVDAMLDNAAMVTLSSAGAGVFALASGVYISVTATGDTKAGSYVLLAGSDLSELDNVDFDALYHLTDFDANNLVASWQLDHGKTDTLTLIVSEKPAVSLLNFAGTQELGTGQLSATSLLTDGLTAGLGDAWSHTALA